MQHLLSRAECRHDGVRDELRALVCQTLSPPGSALDESPFPVLVLDESGFPKRGRHSAGVGLQYCGVTGEARELPGGRLSLLRDGAFTMPSSIATCMCPKTGALI